MNVHGTVQWESVGAIYKPLARRSSLSFFTKLFSSPQEPNWSTFDLVAEV